MVRERVCHRQRLPPPRAAPPLLHQRQSRVGGHRRLVRDRRRGSMPWPAALNCGCCSGTAGGVSGTDTAAELCSALPRPAVPSAVRAWTGACGAGVAATSTIGRDELDFGTVHTSAAAATPAVAAATPAAPAALGVAVATSCAAGGNRQPSAPLIQREPTRNGHVAGHAHPSLRLAARPSIAAGLQCVGWCCAARPTGATSAGSCGNQSAASPTATTSVFHAQASGTARVQAVTATAAPAKQLPTLLTPCPIVAPLSRNRKLVGRHGTQSAECTTTGERRRSVHSPGDPLQSLFCQTPY